jgi:putative DNA primase/helicase
MSKIDLANDLQVANHIIKTHDLFFCNQFFYTFNDGYWSIVDDRKIKGVLLEILKERYKQTAVKNIMDIISLHAGKDESEINLNEKTGMINVKNGFFDVGAEKLIPHSNETKKYYSTNQFNVNYAPGASCPRWLQFLDEIFEGDDDSSDKILMLQEFMGLTLTRETKHEKALFLLGNGSNGKSVILEILSAILGDSNYSSLEFDQISKQFLTFQLMNKLVNLCTDIDYYNKASFGQFKRIVTGEPILADIKNKKPIQFRPHCKLIFAANRLPQTTDTSKGYFRRLLVLKLNQSFEGSRKDKDLKRKLLNEIDGIFLWMIDGLQRLQATGKFTIPESCEVELAKYLENSNSVVSFITDQCEIKKQHDYWTGYQELYDAYKEFCGNAGVKPFKKTEMRQEIVDRQFKNHVDFVKWGERGNHFQNIRIRNKSPF